MLNKTQMAKILRGNRLAKYLLFAASCPGASLLILMLLCLSCNNAVGGTYYVDSENGSDSYDGLSATFQGGNSGPWKTIFMVNSNTYLPGDSILFKRGGAWADGPLEPRNGGMPGGVISIQDSVIGQPLRFDLVDPENHKCIYFGAYGDSPEKPRIDCRGDLGIVLLHNYIIVEGLHLDNGGNNMLWLGRESGNSWIIIDSVDVTNCSANAVRVSYGGGNIWLKGLYVYNYGVNGILLNGSPDNKLKEVLVENCWVENPETLELEDGITCHRDSDDNDLAGNIIIRNNTILGAGEDGIDITSGSNILLAGNDIRYSHAGGIYVNFQWVNTVEIRGNFMYSNSLSQGYGDLTVRSPRVRAINNIIAGAGHHSVLIGDTDDTQFWNNVIAPANRTGNLIWLREGIGELEFKNNIFDFSQSDQDISGDITANIVFDNNCYYGTSSGQEIYGNLSFEALRNENPNFEPNGIWADPKFLHPARNIPEHFKISLASSCRDAGADLSVDADFWGTPRRQGNRIDLGAHEVVTRAVYGPGNIGARAWHDKNGNCRRETGEAGLSGILANLYDADGKLLAINRSGPDGSFRFDKLPAGDYRVGVDPSNFNPGQPLEGKSSTCNPDKNDISFTVSIGQDAPAKGQDFGFAGSPAAGIELLDFKVEKTQGGVQLSWASPAESNAGSFEVERSDDGKRFFARGYLKGRPSSSGNPSYHFTDDDPPKKLAYYRLKQIGKDGRFTYSEIKPANPGNQQTGIKLFPNPFSERLDLTLDKGKAIDKLWIIDGNGRTVFEKRIRDASLEISLQLGHLPPGSYYLIVRSDKGSGGRMAFPDVIQ